MVDERALVSTAATADKPIWVRVGLWHVGSRRTALFYAVLSAALATAAVGVGLMGSPLFLAGGGLYLAALWYWSAVRWMDARDAWEHARLPSTSAP